MNYDYSIITSYALTTLSLNTNSAYALCDNGTILNVSTTSDSFDVVTQAVNNAVVNNYYVPNGYVYVDADYLYLVSTRNVDFWKITNLDREEDVSVVSQELANNGNDEETPFDDLASYSLYYQATANNVGDNSASSFGVFNKVLEYNEYCVFDLSNTYYPQDSSYLNYQLKQYTSTVNTNNVSYYYRPTILTIAREGNLTFGCGKPYQNMGSASYWSGYADGENTGYNNGYKDGYDVGLSMDSQKADAFNYISQAFNCVAGIMSLEIIPHVTLGLCFSVPFCVVMIMVLFKMVKK